MADGTYRLTMTDCGTLELPGEVVRPLGPAVVLFRGVDGCLMLCAQDRFDNCMDAMMPPDDHNLRTLRRFIAGSAYATGLGPDGALEIPAELTSFTGLGSAVVLTWTGVHARLVAADPSD